MTAPVMVGMFLDPHPLVTFRLHIAGYGPTQSLALFSGT
jgi:hypothetical protein